MSQSDPNNAGEPESDYTTVSVPDEQLPEDLQPGGDNPLAEPPDDDAEIQDLGDPHIEGLERADDDNLSLPDADADPSADPSTDPSTDPDGGDDAHRTNPDSHD